MNPSSDEEVVEDPDIDVDKEGEDSDGEDVSWLGLSLKQNTISNTSAHVESEEIRNHRWNSKITKRLRKR